MPFKLLNFWCLKRSSVDSNTDRCNVTFPCRLPEMYPADLIHGARSFMFTLMKRIQYVWSVLLLFGFSFQEHGASSFLKTIRFDHGHPIIIRSGDAFLVLEFETNAFADVHWDSGTEFQVRAPYGYLVFEGSDQTIPPSQTGKMIEYYSYHDIVKEDGTVSRQVKNIGSVSN